MYAMLNALAAGSEYLRDIAYGDTGNNTNPADGGDDPDQVTGDASTDSRIIVNIHSCE